MDKRQPASKEETRALIVAEEQENLKADDLAILASYVGLLSSFIDLASLYMERDEDLADDLKQEQEQASDTGPLVRSKSRRIRRG